MIILDPRKASRRALLDHIEYLEKFICKFTDETKLFLPGHKNTYRLLQLEHGTAEPEERP